MIAASLLVIGLLVATRQGAARGRWAAGLVAPFALFHGAAHGTELAGTMRLAGAGRHAGWPPPCCTLAGMALGRAAARRASVWLAAPGRRRAWRLFGAVLLVLLSPEGARP